MDKYAIIVAGGRGTRMNVEQPKQFLELNQKPILVHTIDKFLQTEAGIRITLVLPEDHMSTWKRIQKDFLPGIKINTVVGGVSRTDSVRAGLGSINGDGLVAIHDGVRPFVSHDVIQRAFESAAEYGSGVAAVPLKDSIRELLGSDHSVSRSRDNYMLIQTPQTFRLEEIKEAYNKLEEVCTDDATVYEKAGFKVRLVEGDYANIKITTTEDLK